MTGSAEPDANPFVGPRPIEAGERLWGRGREIRLGAKCRDWRAALSMASGDHGPSVSDTSM